MLCRGAVDICDRPDPCSGVDVQCPDLRVPGGTVCRPAVDPMCDLAESCDGIDPQCPGDVYVATGEPCDDGDGCSVGDSCQAGICVSGTPLTCDDENPCTEDTCRTSDGACVHTQLPDGASCADASGCNGVETCLAGSCQSGTLLDCGDGDPCTSDTCGAVACQHAAIAGCDPSDSAESLVGGPDMRCDDGVLEVSTNTCVLSTGSVELRIPLAGSNPPLPTATNITVAGLADSALCTSAFVVGAGNGPSDVRIVSCTEFQPEGLMFPPGSGVTMRFRWTDAGPPGCPVASLSGVSRPEGQLRVFEDGLNAATAPCGSSSATDPLCPQENSLAYPGSGFFSDAVCEPGADRWEVHNVVHFSRHGIVTVCNPMSAPKLKIGGLNRPAGSQTLGFKGFFDSSDQLDLVASGLGVALYDVQAKLFDVLLPPGAEDPTTRAGWTAKDGKWSYRNKDATRPGGISKVIVKQLDTGYYAITLKARDVFFASSTPYAEVQIALPGNGACFGRSYPGGGWPSCVRKRNNILCR